MKTNQNQNREILIYTERESFPGGRAYLQWDGTLCSDKANAHAAWESQFDVIVAANWIVKPAKMEFTGNVR